MEENYMKEVRKFFKPEFINRIDEIVVFNALQDEVLNKIAHKFMKELKLRLAKKDITLKVEDSVYAQIAKEGVDPIFGARPMKRYIQKHIETLLARRMIELGYTKEETLTLSCKDDTFVVDVM